MGKLKVVFHVDEMAKWSLTLINVRNLLRDTKQEVEVIVIANSEAVEGFKPNYELAHVMTKQNGNGIVFEACANALKAHDLGKDTILDFVQIIPNSITELINRQQDGFAYIKP